MEREGKERRRICSERCSMRMRGMTHSPAGLSASMANDGDLPRSRKARRERNALVRSAVHCNYRGGRGRWWRSLGRSQAQLFVRVDV